MKNSNDETFNATIGNTVLCDGFLIPMTDFVLRINEIEKEIDQFFDSWRMKQLRIIENYAKFLKQPLKLEMFVPCDDYGNVLKEPINYNIWEELHYNNGKKEKGTIGFDEHLKYQKAKEKVLCEHPLSSLDMIKDYIRAKNTLENFVNMQVSRGRIMKLNKNGMNAIFGTVA